MKVKLDENLPAGLKAALADLGHDTDTVPTEGLTGRDDKAVWQMAQQAGRFLITQDLDFSDIRFFPPGSHHGILLLRLRTPGGRTLFERIGSIFLTESVEGWAGCFVVATERKIRVHRPRP